MDTKELLNFVAQVIFDKKGFNIFALDIRKISTMADYFLIAEGNVDRHVQSLCQSIEEATAKKGIRPLGREGQDSGEWCILDYGDIVIHLFQTKTREHYALEELWQKGGIVDLKLITHPEGTS